MTKQLYDFNHDILSIADNFEEAYKRCSRLEVAGKIYGNTYYSSPNVPIIVIAAFTCELYLKSMLPVNKKIHKLNELFAQLDNVKQSYISESVKMELSDFQFNDFEDCLNSVSNAFVDWRYIYENRRTVGYLGGILVKILNFLILF